MTLHGGIITRRPLCYTADGKLIVAPCGNDIRVYSAQSGEHVASLRGHSAEVTATVQDPNNSQLVGVATAAAAAASVLVALAGSDERTQAAQRKTA